jgi:serine protease Do
VEVREVAPRSMADRAGIRVDDVIIALSGRLVTSIDDLHRLLMTVPVEQGFELTVIRGERQQTVYVPAAG